MKKIQKFVSLTKGQIQHELENGWLIKQIVNSYPSGLRNVFEYDVLLEKEIEVGKSDR